MIKPIEISHFQWSQLYSQLRKDYPPNAILISNNKKAKLGFTVREYRDWDDSIGEYGGWRKICIILDFYSEKKRTFFIMKYSDYLGEESVNGAF